MSEAETVTISGPGIPPTTMTTQQLADLGKSAKASAKRITGKSGTTPPPTEDAPADVSGKRLKSFIERIERLEQEKADAAESIKEVYAEAKGTGFEPRIMRKMVKLRAMDVEKRREEEELTELYKGALGIS